MEGTYRWVLVTIMCIYDSPPTVCSSLCGHDSSGLGPSALQPLSAFLLSAQLLMEQQAPALHCITEQMQQLKDSMRSVRSDLVALRLMPKFAALYPRQEASVETPLTVDANQLVAYLTAGELVVYSQALKLVSDLPNPLYKHQSFS